MQTGLAALGSRSAHPAFSRPVRLDGPSPIPSASDCPRRGGGAHPTRRNTCNNGYMTNNKYEHATTNNRFVLMINRLHDPNPEWVKNSKPACNALVRLVLYFVRLVLYLGTFNLNLTYHRSMQVHSSGVEQCSNYLIYTYLTCIRFIFLCLQLYTSILNNIYVHTHPLFMSRDQF